MKISLRCLSKDSKILSPVQLQPKLQQILQAMSHQKNTISLKCLIPAAENYKTQRHKILHFHSFVQAL
jgi:hypothetical protein